MLHVLITGWVFSSSSVLLWLLLLLQGSQPRTHRVEGKLWCFLAYTCEHSWDSGISLSEWSWQRCQLRSCQCKAVVEPWGWAPWEIMERKEGWWLHLRKTWDSYLSGSKRKNHRGEWLSWEKWLAGERKSGMSWPKRQRRDDLERGRVGSGATEINIWVTEFWWRFI